MKELKRALNYDPQTGILRWVVNVGKKRLIGRIAGTLHPHGYVRIRLNRKNYYAHRIAWLLFYGEWPKGRLDHRDGNPANNRISNLRLATGSQNLMNAKLRSDNVAGYKGVWPHQGGFYTRVQVGGTRFTSKRFPTAREAARERKRLAVLHHGEFVR